MRHSFTQLNRAAILLVALLLTLSLINCGGGGGGGGSGASSHASTNAVARISLSKDSDSSLMGAIRFDGSSSTVDGATNGNPSITTYHWDFGDGNLATGAIVSHAYDSNVSLRPYTATLTVTDSSGDTSSTRIATTYSLSGVITAASNSAVDVDVNDPSRQNKAVLGANFTTNDKPEQAQRLPNPMILNGFVSARPTGTPPAGVSNFADSTDYDDFYSAYLLRGQFVSIRVADYKKQQPSANDLDLYLYDAAFLYDETLPPVAHSFPYSSEFKSVAVPADGEYFIRVQAYSGVNKYILNIDSSSLVSGAQAYGNSAKIIPGQAIVKMKVPTIATHGSAAGATANTTANTTVKAATHTAILSPLRAPLRGLTHHDRSRATLMQLDLAAVTANASKQAANNGNNTAQESTELMATLQQIKQLNARDDVEYAEPNYRVTPRRVPNDPFYTYQWHYPQINLPQAWNISTGTNNPPVIVAVVDTGIVSGHEDLIGKLVAGYDFIRHTADAEDQGDGGGSSPSSWHGTHVAGTIAAASNNNRGVAGVSWGAKIMPIRALGVGGGSSYDVIQSIRFAAGLSNDSGTVPAAPADIINLSLGGSGYSQASQDLFNQLHSAGIIVVAAAGNENSATPDYPASYNHVIAVSATDHNNNLAPYSNYGDTISLAAPGGDASVDRDGDGYNDGILSTLFNTETGRDNYAFYEGTSMATPHVAGVAALMKDVYPSLTATEFTSSLQSGSLTSDLGAPGKDPLYGYGIIDALKAVQQAQALAGGTVTGSVSASPSRIDFGRASNTQSITLSSYGSAPPTVDSVGIRNQSTWLSIDATAANTDGSGDYSISVNRNSLGDAIYSDSIIFTLEDASIVEVPVSMQVKTSGDLDADTGYLYVLLLDADSYENVAQFSVDVIDGEYHYHFNHIPFGEYVIIAGSDIDNDYIICNLGESCGNYPTNDQPQRIIIDGNKENVNFLVSIMTDLITTSSNNAESKQGFSRDPAPKNRPAKKSL